MSVRRSLTSLVHLMCCSRDGAKSNVGGADCVRSRDRVLLIQTNNQKSWQALGASLFWVPKTLEAA